MPTGYETFDYLSEEIEAAKAECSRLFEPWKVACEKLNKLERERSIAWRKLVDQEAHK